MGEELNVGKCVEVLANPARISFGGRLWDGLMASKLQFNAQRTTGSVFPAKATKGRSWGLWRWITLLLSFERTKHWRSRAKRKNWGVFTAAVSRSTDNLLDVLIDVYF